MNLIIWLKNKWCCLIHDYSIEVPCCDSRLETWTSTHPHLTDVEKHSSLDITGQGYKHTKVFKTAGDKLKSKDLFTSVQTHVSCHKALTETV